MGMTKETRSGVDIPDEAYEAALAVPGTRDMVRSYMTHTLCTQGSAEADVLQAVEAAAPLIVAAELDGLLREMRLRGAGCNEADQFITTEDVQARIKQLRGEV